MGPNSSTLRDVNVPGSWRGLSLRDRAVLSTWLNAPGREVSELHTDVCVGEISDELRAAAGGIPERQLEAMYALRIDALVRFGADRCVVECKAWANAHALGQVLTYRSMLHRLGTAWIGCSAVVCSCGCDGALVEVFAEFGVESVEVGPVVL